MMGVFLDLPKAFDPIDHVIPKQLEWNTGVALEWFRSYLSNRKQCVHYTNSHSPIHPPGCTAQS